MVSPPQTRGGELNKLITGSDMDEKELSLTSSCKLTAYAYENIPPDVYLEYTEYSPDTWYENTETEVTIEKEKAIEIIEFLTKAFSL